MKRIIAICLLLAICSASFAEKPRKPRKKPYNRVRPLKSEVVQKKVATVMLVGIGIVSMWAIQDGIENRERK